MWLLIWLIVFFIMRKIGTRIWIRSHCITLTHTQIQDQIQDHTQDQTPCMDLKFSHLSNQPFLIHESMTNNYNHTLSHDSSHGSLDRKTLQQIDQYLCLRDKLNLRNCCKLFSTLQIIEIYPVDDGLIKQIEINTMGQILRQEKYKSLQILRLIDSLSMDLNFLTHLKMLNIQGSEIRDQDISALSNLQGINVSGCQNITDLNNCHSLRILVACNETGLSDQSIKDLRFLEFVNVSNNSKITTISHTNRLKTLVARSKSGISDHSLRQMDMSSLEALDIRDNDSIQDIGQMVNLKKLRTKNDDLITWFRGNI
jgi:hypothetical protein